MATQDERIGALEYNLNQFKTETFKAYQDLTMETVMLKGLMEDSIKRSMIMRAQIASLEQNMNSRFESLEQNVNGRFESLGQNVNGRFESLGQNVNGRFEVQDKRFGSLEQKVDGLSERFDRLVQLLLDRLPPA